jgi:replicative DNA helicase
MEKGIKTARRDLPGKVPPQNIEAEQSLLGSILLKSTVVDLIIPLITADDFYEPRHRTIYGAMMELHKTGAAIDILTLSEKLRITGSIEECGGALYISDLSNYVPASIHAEDYAKIVREKADLRRLIGISADIIERSYREEELPRDIIQNAETEIFNITEKSRGSLVLVREMVGDVYEHIEKMGKMEETITGIETGFKLIDDATSGLNKGDLVIVAARPSLGKTSLVLNIAYRIATRKNKNVLFFSFEMSAEDLVRRMLAVGSRVSMQKIRTGKYMTKDERQKILDVAGFLSETRIFIDTDDNGVFEMRSKVRTAMSQLKREGKTLDLVIIDYMQLVRPDKSIPQREQQIAAISRGLKSLAREAQVPVVALSQLNRESEKRDRTKSGKRVPPKLSDLRESGSIEQDADIVIFIDREEDKDASGVESSDSAPDRTIKIRKCKLMIAKNRNGPIVDQSVLFLPELTAFEESTELNTDEAFS